MIKNQKTPHILFRKDSGTVPRQQLKTMYGSENILSSPLSTTSTSTARYDEYISHLYEASCGIVRRNTSVCYYDCNNLCFETGSQVLTALNAVFDLQLDRQYYQPKELNKKIKEISG